MSDMQGHSMSAKALFFILAGIAAVGYYGYDRHMKPKKADESAQRPRGHEVLEASHPAYFGTKEPGGVVLRLKPETAAGLSRISGSANVGMFATTWCPYCAQARQVFGRNGVRFAELDVEHDLQAKRFLEETMGMSGFPIIVIGNRVTAGFDEGQILASLKEL